MCLFVCLYYLLVYLFIFVYGKKGARKETRNERILNTFGPRKRLNDGRVLPAFIKQSQQGKPLTAFGVGSQTRSFTYVDDLIEGIFRLLHSKYANPVNIGNLSLKNSI